MPFEKIDKYIIRRKIIHMLRRAVNDYINVELLKNVVDEQKDNQIERDYIGLNDRSHSIASESSGAY